MSLESTVVLGVDLPSSRASAEALVRLVQQMTHAGDRRVILVAGADSAARESAVARANRLPPTADPYAVARTMISCHLEAAAALTASLVSAGAPAVLLEPEIYSPLTRGGPLDAEQRVVDARAFADALETSRVVVLPGAIGRDFDTRLTSVGDEGALITALFIAQRLALDVVEVDTGAEPGAVPRRAALFARRHGLGFDTLSLDGQFARRFDPLAPAPVSGERLRVALLGLGRVGAGVYERLTRAPGRYQIVGVALGRGDARFAAELPVELASFDGHEILSRRADVVIDLTDDGDPLAELADEARRQGLSVVRGVAGWAPEPRARFQPRVMTGAATA